MEPLTIATGSCQCHARGEEGAHSSSYLLTPEQVQHQLHVGFLHSDVYSLAVPLMSQGRNFCSLSQNHLLEVKAGQWAGLSWSAGKSSIWLTARCLKLRWVCPRQCSGYLFFVMCCPGRGDKRSGRVLGASPCCSIQAAQGAEGVRWAGQGVHVKWLWQTIISVVLGSPGRCAVTSPGGVTLVWADWPAHTGLFSPRK